MNLYLTVCQLVRSTSQIIFLDFQKVVVKCFVYLANTKRSENVLKTL